MNGTEGRKVGNVLFNLYFDPCWFGVRVTFDPPNSDGVPVITRLHVGLVPCFPIRVSWWNV